jgi:hypothetical protein
MGFSMYVFLSRVQYFQLTVPRIRSKFITNPVSLHIRRFLERSDAGVGQGMIGRRASH